ncbi:hypothetical protein A2866_02230 [Candidatus Roizmanbacteria bacterium RIFCSPHIGHO2_01_FULL_39_8]|uniref:LytR/CpsA/Psr regulator C-terminal domain-containing protein n=3 Tax=Candidatus Roizmaniibacteriota TaxID=1752723 RepID=A0A1F7GFT4_9BACT|nr:MAG: hypothetical protein A2866_02230 [Candidatus Roizmanbacteria bacterium RIFCSPHIGHO2_01_FULL_39_8]OGK25371.1 MAG: hypothetical protein A3C28_01305 [Candidatus Roizmanbacteria bacterium RIFCSPHIGHO2_02_FULL_39_9]OGK37467.1 MAG: hypothetical protein A3F60_05125 [Candidatus Roizmanbacteria bacterium RIFCSPHIGHO2_12_FULL_39_8]
MKKKSNIKYQKSKIRNSHPEFSSGSVFGKGRFRTKFGMTILLFFLLFISYKFFLSLRSSAFFQKKDRINIVVEEINSEFFSFGLDDGVNYYISFFPDLETVVPGGYGYYRLGGIAKLASLDKKPLIYTKTFSYATSSFIDYYFYPSTSSDRIKVYFGTEKKDFSLPSFSLIFFGESNALFFDRVYVYLMLLGKTKGQFKSIQHIPVEKKADTTILSHQDFFSSLQGNFYKRTYRLEQKSVQLLYTKSYSTAQAISQMLEGEGIRVADLSESGNSGKNCEIVEESDSFSYTALTLSSFFDCNLVRNTTDAYDIIVKLGDLEKEWEIEK